MKICGRASAFAAAAKIAASAAGSKSIPILSAALIDAGDTIAFSGTDLDLSLRAECAGTVEAAGCAAVPADALSRRRERDESTIAARADNITLTARLIDGTFPHYQSFIPSAVNATAEVDRAPLMAALSRMAVIAKTERPTVTLGWNGNGGARLAMGGGKTAEDIIAAETTGAAEIGLAVGRFRELVDAIDAERLRLGIVSATEPMLVSPTGDGDLLAILCPCHDH